MAEEHVEDDVSQLKRKAIRDLMFDRSLSPKERTRQVQLIMSGKIKPGENTQHGATASATSVAAPSSMPTQSTPPLKSTRRSSGGEHMEGGEKPPPPVFDPVDSFEDKLRTKMDEINNNSHSSSVSTELEAMDDFEARIRNKSVGGDTKPSAFAQSNLSFDEGSKLADSTNEPPSSNRRSSNELIGSEAMDDFEARIRNKAGELSAVTQSRQFDDLLRSKLANSNMQSSSEDGGDGRSSYESNDAEEVSTIGGGDGSTLEIGTIGDESDLSSLVSKSSLTSRNLSKRLRAAALEAKIAAKMSKAGGAAKDENTEDLKGGENGHWSKESHNTDDRRFSTSNRSLFEDSDGEYTFETASCFTLELKEHDEPSSSSHGVGHGSLPMPEEHFPGDEVPMSNRGSIISMEEDSLDIEVLRNSIATSYSLRGGEEPNVPNSSSLDGLAVATAVAPDDEPDYVYQAIEYDPNSKPPLHKNRRFRVYTYFALLLIVIVVALVVVYVTSMSKEAEIKNVVIRLTNQPTPQATAAPTTFREAQGLIEQLQAGVLLRNESFEDMQVTDPRRLALDWILHKDDQRLVSDAVNLYQRYGLAVLAYSMDSRAWKVCGNPGENFTETSCSVYSSAMNETVDFGVWLSGESECDWFGVTCSNDGIVRGVELISNNLVGVLPHELTALKFIQILALAGNCIYGTLPEELGQLDHLLSLELHENGLSGDMPSTFYQMEKLQLLNLARQYGVDRTCEQSNGTKVNTNFKHGGFINEFNVGLTGKLGEDVAKWKSMKGMYLSQNSFTGEITEGIGNLRYLTFLHVNDNFIEGNLPTTITNLRNLRDLRLDDNFLYTSLPEDIGNMKDLEILSVNGNSMFGTIPQGLYALKKLKSLFLHDTAEANSPWLITDQEGFSGPLSSSVGNLKDLEYLLLNNNPITGEIPSDLGNCTKLKVLRLHRTNLKGSMPREVCMLRDKALNSEEGVGVLYADCRPNNRTGDPMVQCDCCTDCCDHTTDVCVRDD